VQTLGSIVLFATRRFGKKTMPGAIGKTSCGLTIAPTAVQRWMEEKTMDKLAFVILLSAALVFVSVIANDK
jgi:hypothetical protein